MNAREWASLTAARAPWAELAAGLEGQGAGLEAYFDDSGRCGLAAAAGAGGWRRILKTLDGRGFAAPGGPAPDRAWLVFDGVKPAELWSVRLGRSARVWRAAAGEPAAQAPLARTAPGGTGVPELDAILLQFAGLHPVAEVLTGLDRLEVRLAEPAAWPLFARTDLAKPFAGRPAFWARRLGARGVSAFALGRGRMEIFVA